MLLHIAQLSGGGGGKVYLISQRERRGGPAACPAPLIHLPLAAAPLWATDRGVSPPPLSPYAHTWYCTVFSSPRASIKREGGIHTQKRQISPLKGEGGGERKECGSSFFPFFKSLWASCCVPFVRECVFSVPISFASKWVVFP